MKKFERQKCDPFEEISREEFQKRIRENFPDCWDENGKFKHDGLAAFTKDGKEIFWFSNPHYEKLTRNQMEIRSAKVEIPHLKEWEQNE